MIEESAFSMARRQTCIWVSEGILRGSELRFCHFRWSMGEDVQLGKSSRKGCYEYAGTFPSSHFAYRKSNPQHQVNVNVSLTHERMTGS